VKKVLVNSEPSTHGTNGKAANVRLCAAYRGRADFDPSR
jgi:hypothetical protein